jgi:hypothetical protein
VNTPAVLVLLFVAAGLLVLAGTGIGRVRGRPVTRGDAAGMAGMTGVAVAFLFVVMPVLPLIVLPAAIAGVLGVSWVIARQWHVLGAFLIGGGLLVVIGETYRRLNDLADPAVVIPGWSPVPLAVGAAITVLGATLAIVSLRWRSPPPAPPL